MDTGTLLLVFVSELVVLVLFVWFVRYSNQRLMQEIVGLEKQLKQVNDFINHVSRSQKKLRHELSVRAEGAAGVSENGKNPVLGAEPASPNATLAVVQAREK